MQLNCNKLIRTRMLGFIAILALKVSNRAQLTVVYVCLIMNMTIDPIESLA